MLQQLLWTRPRIEAALSELDKSRLKLPKLSLAKLFVDFDTVPVTVEQVPIGPWSTPLADVVMLMKIIGCARPIRMLEVGSFRGCTALMMINHAPDDATLVTVDRAPNHGDAYRDRPQATRIERRVCDITPAAFAPDASGSYDLIFLDADHSYAAVKHDTEILLPLVKPDGFFVWHDYGNWGKFSGKNGVPEYLHQLSMTRPVAVVAGSQLGIHSPAWSASGADRFHGAILGQHEQDADPWTSETSRG